jgi:hypothetical protein
MPVASWLTRYGFRPTTYPLLIAPNDLPRSPSSTLGLDEPLPNAPLLAPTSWSPGPKAYAEAAWSRWCAWGGSGESRVVKPCARLRPSSPRSIPDTGMKAGQEPAHHPRNVTARPKVACMFWRECDSTLAREPCGWVTP